MIGSIIAKKKLEAGFKHLCNKNLNKFMSDWSDDGVFYYPGELSVSGKFEGKLQIQEWFNNMIDHYKTIDFKINHVCVENMFDVTGNNNLIAQWTVNLENKDGTKVTNIGANLVKIRARKIVEVRDFFYHQERLHIGWAE